MKQMQQQQPQPQYQNQYTYDTYDNRSRNPMPNRQGYYPQQNNYRGNIPRNNGRMYYGDNRNFAPQVPMEYAIFGALCFIALIVFLLIKSIGGLGISAGLVIAGFGFVRKKLNEPNYMTLILAGAVLALLGIFLC